MRCSNLYFCFLFLVLSPRHSAAPRALLVVACTLRTQSHRCLRITLEQGIAPGRRQGVPGIDTGRVGERAPPNKAKTQSFDGTRLTRATYLHTVAIVCGPQNSRIRGRAVPRFTSMLEVSNNLPARAFSFFQASQQHSLNDKSEGKMCSTLARYVNVQNQLLCGPESSLLRGNSSGD